MKNRYNSLQRQRARALAERLAIGLPVHPTECESGVGPGVEFTAAAAEGNAWAMASLSDRFGRPSHDDPAHTTSSAAFADGAFGDWMLPYLLGDAVAAHREGNTAGAAVPAGGSAAHTPLATALSVSTANPATSHIQVEVGGAAGGTPLRADLTGTPLRVQLPTDPAPPAAPPDAFLHLVLGWRRRESDGDVPSLPADDGHAGGTQDVGGAAPWPPSPRDLPDLGDWSLLEGLDCGHAEFLLDGRGGGATVKVDPPATGPTST